MTRRRKNQSQQKHEESLQKPDEALSKTNKAGEEPDDSDVITPNMILPSSSTPPLLNAQIIQILVQRDTPEEVEKLMRAELDYNKERLQILREHAEKHPDAIEERQTRGFRRTQYKFLMLALFGLLAAIPFVSLAAAATFGLLCILIVAAISLNGREREIDMSAFVRIITAIVRKEP